MEIKEYTRKARTEAVYWDGKGSIKELDEWVKGRAEFSRDNNNKLYVYNTKFSNNCYEIPENCYIVNGRNEIYPMATKKFEWSYQEVK